MKIRRRHRGRRNNKKQFVIISVSLLLFVFILGTAYSAFSTNLTLNASGEVIQPEYVSIGGNDVEVVSSGDGLYADSYESGRYIYRGGDPDNYILLGDELYRIIAKEEDGTYKVIRSSSLGSMVFDPGYVTAIDDDILTTDLGSVVGTRYSSSEDDYCYQSSGTEEGYSGCGIWGSGSTMLNSNGENIDTMPWVIGGDEKNLPDTEAYLNLYLNQIYYSSLNNNVQKVITNHIFNVGLVPYSGYTLSKSIKQEQAYKWYGKIGLASATDYVRASTNSYCITVGTYAYYGNETDANCYTTAGVDNWMYKGSYYWLITRLSEGGDNGGRAAWVVHPEGNLGGGYAVGAVGVRPVFYLSSSIILQGEGTESSPYEIIS